MAAVLLLLVTALPARAHASFVSSQPRPGTGLPQAPGEVVLRFSEPLVLSGSTVEVRDAAGTVATDGPVESVEGSPKVLQRDLGLLAPGVYTVRWTTLSPLDGHTLRGEYKFAIGSSTLGDERVQASPLSSEGPLGLVGRFVALSGLAVWIGVALVAGPARRAGLADRRRRSLLRWGALAAAAGTAVSLVGTALVSAGDFAALPAVLVGGRSGMLRATVFVLAAVGALTARRAPRMTAVLAGLAVLAEASSGHAGSNPDPLLASSAFASHLLAVGVWVDAVVISLLTDRPTKQALRVFAPVAVVAGVAVALTGVASAALELTGVRDLVDTAYGRTVLLKTLPLLGMAAAGIVHNRRRRRQAATPSLRRPLVVEVLAAAVGIAVATALVGFPNPPREEDAASVAQDVPGRLAQLVDTGPVLSFGSATGPYVLGVTVAPPQPGEVTVLAQVLGADPGDAVRDMQLSARGPDGDEVRTGLETCGEDCWQGEAVLQAQGRWELEVTATSNRGPLRAAIEVDLPTPDGQQEFDRLIAAMSELGSARVDEELRNSLEEPVIASEYRFVAPDRMRWDVAGGSSRVATGATGYLRPDDDAPWNRYPWPGEGFRWPGSFYRSFFTDVRAVRTVDPDAQVDGRPATELTFVQPTYPAWYRAWIDPTTSRLLRLEMRASRHVMDQVYGPYDVPLDIPAPPDADVAASDGGTDAP